MHIFLFLITSNAYENYKEINFSYKVEKLIIKNSAGIYIIKNKIYYNKLCYWTLFTFKGKNLFFYILKLMVLVFRILGKLLLMLKILPDF